MDAFLLIKFLSDIKLFTVKVALVKFIITFIVILATGSDTITLFLDMIVEIIKDYIRVAACSFWLSTLPIICPAWYAIFGFI